jgi:hypothetical protein
MKLPAELPSQLELHHFVAEVVFCNIGCKTPTSQHLCSIFNLTNHAEDFFFPSKTFKLLRTHIYTANTVRPFKFQCIEANPYAFLLRQNHFTDLDQLVL